MCHSNATSSMASGHGWSSRDGEHFTLLSQPTLALGNFEKREKILGWEARKITPDFRYFFFLLERREMKKGRER